MFIKSDIDFSWGDPATGAGKLELGNVSSFYIYIIANQHHTVLYTGITNDLARRVFEHKNKLLKGFTAKYNCDKLLYFEESPSIEEALHREKQVKHYKRDWKINLIESLNPTWRDLVDDFEV